MAHQPSASSPPRRPALVRDQRGVTTAIFAISLTALVGVAGLATEVGVWYQDWVQIQGAADAAAMAGAVSVSVAAEKSNGGPVATAKYVATQNGYTATPGGVSVTINYPPTSGTYKGNTSAVEAIISKTETARFGALFMKSGPTLTARSVALYSANKGTCMLALGKASGAGGNGTLTLSGNASVNALGCSVTSDSTSSSGVSLSGNSTISAYTVLSSGGISKSGNAGMTLQQAAGSNRVATADPLSAVQSVPLPASSQFPTSGCASGTPSAPGCWTSASVGGNSSLTLPGGTYQFTNGITASSNGSMSLTATTAGNTFYINGGINISGNAKLDIAPGTYFLNNSSLSVSGNGSLTCSACVAGGAGVTFVLMGSSPGTVQISGNAPVTLSAPTANNYNSGLDGVAIYEAPNDTGTNVLAGNGSITLQGALYSPGAALSISGNGVSGSATCSVYIANTITLSGNAGASDNKCANDGYAWANIPTPSGVTLVE